MANATPQKQTAAKKTEKVTLLKTVQLEPYGDPLLPGEHTLPADVAEELKKEGLAK